MEAADNSLVHQQKEAAEKGNKKERKEESVHGRGPDRLKAAGKRKTEEKTKIRIERRQGKIETEERRKKRIARKIKRRRKRAAAEKRGSIATREGDTAAVQAQILLIRERERNSHLDHFS